MEPRRSFWPALYTLQQGESQEVHSAHLVLHTKQNLRSGAVLLEHRFKEPIQGERLPSNHPWLLLPGRGRGIIQRQSRKGRQDGQHAEVVLGESFLETLVDHLEHPQNPAACDQGDRHQ